MAAFFAWLLKSNVLKMILSFLMNKLFEWLGEKQKEAFLDEKLQEHIKEKLAEYEQVVELSNRLALDGLSEEEKNEIRQRKIEIEASLVNYRSGDSKL